jgi:hypothetical protein
MKTRSAIPSPQFFIFIFEILNEYIFNRMQALKFEHILVDELRQ